MVFKKKKTVKKAVKKTTRKIMSKVRGSKVKKTTKKQHIDEGTVQQWTNDRAYYIWQELGCPQGQDAQIWQQAEVEMRARVT